MRVRAFAKINRSLRIVGVRPDGYHELRTEFQSIALHDTLSLHATRGPFGLTCDDPECPADAPSMHKSSAVILGCALLIPSDATRDIPIIATTAFALRGDEEKH